MFLITWKWIAWLGFCTVVPGPNHAIHFNVSQNKVCCGKNMAMNEHFGIVFFKDGGQLKSVCVRCLGTGLHCWKYWGCRTKIPVCWMRENLHQCSKWWPFHRSRCSLPRLTWLLWQPLCLVTLHWSCIQRSCSPKACQESLHCHPKTWK